MKKEESFVDFLVTKINNAEIEKCSIRESSSSEEPHMIGDMTGSTIKEWQIDAIIQYRDFLDKIPKEFYKKYANLICIKLDHYNFEGMGEFNYLYHDNFKEYRTEEPNKVRKRVLNKIKSLRKELESAEEYMKSNYHSEDEYGYDDSLNCIKQNSKYYKLVSLLDELARYLETEDKEVANNIDNNGIAPYGKFYPPYKVSKTNTLVILFQDIIKNLGIKGHSLDAKQLASALIQASLSKEDKELNNFFESEN